MGVGMKVKYFWIYIFVIVGIFGGAVLEFINSFNSSVAGIGFIAYLLMCILGILIYDRNNNSKLSK